MSALGGAEIYIRWNVLLDTSCINKETYGHEAGGAPRSVTGRLSYRYRQRGIAAGNGVASRNIRRDWLKSRR